MCFRTKLSRIVKITILAVGKLKIPEKSITMIVLVVATVSWKKVVWVMTIMMMMMAMK